MTAARSVLSEDQFLCSICLDVFTDPVTIPCGHNVCKSCITEYWRINFLCQCPLCKEVFKKTPQLKINTFISEMVCQFREQAQHKPNSHSLKKQAAKPGEVPCDVCTDIKVKALKTCLVCLTSYCQSHLEPHMTVSHLKRHQLIDAVENLEDRTCLKHVKLLELFCRTDQTCICVHCTLSEHKTHKFVPLIEEYERQKAELKKTEAEIQQMVQERELKIVELKQSVWLGKKAADRETAEGVKVFAPLMESCQSGLNKVFEEIEEKQKRTEKQAEDLIEELEREISELKKRSTVVKQLSHCADHLHFLQTFTSIKAPLPMKTWTKVSICPPSYKGIVMRAVSQLGYTRKLQQAELRSVQQFAVDVALDPDTAHPKLILSDDYKQVYCGDVRKKIRDHPERFSHCVCVLGKQSFSSGRFYFEVQVGGKTAWDVGVVRHSIHRKGSIIPSPGSGFWIIALRNGEYKACTAPRVCLSLKSPLQKVGVFVHYEKGLVSFYDVSATDLIYSFTGCCFTDRLLPYFSPCFKSAPLIITPVCQKHCRIQ